MTEGFTRDGFPPWMPGGVYCGECDYDKHICPGCGAGLEHGEYACDECSE